MLQISAGKFFQSSKLHETTFRGTYYSNYRANDNIQIQTAVGVLRLSSAADGLVTLTYEVVERLEKHPDSPVVGEMISTGGHMVVNDFAAIISLALEVTCTSDPELTRRLTAPTAPALGSAHVPQKFIPRMFDTSVLYCTGDDEKLSSFVKDLIALDRQHFEGAMRAIRRYVTGAHRIGDDVNLAYVLFVMAIESLAQDFDGHVPEWSDYEAKKRMRIDTALSGATDEMAEHVRQAVLQNEHVALSQRFRRFTLKFVDPSYFRSEAVQRQGAISRPDLETALRQAYETRSAYVHRLQDIHKLLVGLPGFSEAIELEGRAALTFSGIARLARHVILQFVRRGPKVEREVFNYSSAFPNMLSLPLAPIYWLDKADAFTVKNAPKFVTAFLRQIAACYIQGAPCSDLRPVLEKIETLLPGLAKPAQRLVSLTLYILFHQIAPPAFHRPAWPAIAEKYEADFRAPHIESLIVRLIGQQPLGWSLAQLNELHRTYFAKRHTPNMTKIGPFFEAAFTLCLAEAHRSHDPRRAGELVALAVECMPQHEGLRNFEARVIEEPTPPIHWMAVLAPSAARTIGLRP